MNKTNIISGVVAVLLLVSAITSGAALIAIQQQPVQAAMSGDRLQYSGPRASIAVSGSSNVYLTWWDNKTGNNEVFFAGSNDGGKTFGKPINLSNAKGGSADSQIAASGSNVYVTWWDNKTGSWQVFSKASTDNGKTFSNDAVMLKSVGKTPVKKLTPTPPSTISVDTIVASSANNEYVVWWDNTTGNWDVFFAKSTDNGKTFGNPVNISNSPDSRSLGARMATPQGSNNVYIAWIDITKNGQKQVMFRSSTDSGNTFGNPVMVNSGS
ncbi:MAG TPA: sialidase family protein [Nitrososphaeraceae archaeon]|nr:sialidase family protein [Nitrososphaeraceae archaeon]